MRARIPRCAALRQPGACAWLDKTPPLRRRFIPVRRPIVEEAAQQSPERLAAQFTQRLRFDSDGHVRGCNIELLTHFFQRVVGVHTMGRETHSSTFASHERSGQPKCREWRHAGLRSWQSPAAAARGGGILDESPRCESFIVADRRFHGDWALGNLQHLTNFIFRYQHPFEIALPALARGPFLQHLARNTVTSFVDGSIIAHRIRWCAPRSAIERQIARRIRTKLRRWRTCNRDGIRTYLPSFIRPMLPLPESGQGTVPRLVFLAIEITVTQVRFNYFFARRAFASPMDMRRLMSFTVRMVRPVSSSPAAAVLQTKRCDFFRDIVQFFRPRFVHRDSGVELCFAGFANTGKQSVIKFFFGILHRSTQYFMIRCS